MDDPAADLNLYSVFANGAPGDTISALTEEERQLLETNYGDSASRDTYRLSRQTVVDTLVSCLGVTGEQAFAMAQEEPGMHYLEQTDHFYTSEMYNTIEAGISAA